MKMKKLINELLFGRNPKISGLIALAVIASIALGCNCGKSFDLSNLTKESNSTSISNDSKTDTSDDSVPSNPVVEGLVKDTTSKFADGVNSGDFSKIYNDASSDF